MEIVSIRIIRKFAEPYTMPPLTRKGHGFIYAEVLDYLEDTHVYTASLIAWIAVEKNLLDPEDHSAQRRMRIAYCKLAINRQFPKTGDGLMIIRGQRPLMAYYGARWKAAVKASFDRFSQPKPEKPILYNHSPWLDEFEE